VSESDAAEARPVLRVVAGAPDPVELAALVAVVTAMSGTDGARGPRPRSTWSAPQRTVRRPLPAGGWRTSFAPR
jgi:hypothetical protein